MSMHTLNLTLNLGHDTSDSEVANELGELLADTLNLVSLEISDSNGQNLFQDDIDVDNEGEG